MPLILDGPIPTHLSTLLGTKADLARTAGTCTSSVRIGFINNMPDPALEDTEAQFFELLRAASDSVLIQLKLYSLPGVPRGERGQKHVNAFYSDAGDLWNDRVDAVIVTGTEPHHTDLRDEPYWPALANTLEWAEYNTNSTVLSCLAAHASVLFSDGIPRRRLPDKRFGVFDFERVINRHPMGHGGRTQVKFPHSRWNEVPAEALTSCGYSILTGSSLAGVDSFVKKKRNSMFLHFQGHPEYGAQTLLREYRRDVRRFLRGERTSYPSVPEGYFDTEGSCIMREFQNMVLSDPREDHMTSFPDYAVVNSLQSTWRPAALTVYRSWLQYLSAQKSEVLAFPVVALTRQQQQRKRSMGRRA